MSGPSSGALEGATKILDGVEIGPHAYDTLHARIAEGLQEKFDLGHKSAGGAQTERAPCMGGWLEIALDQEEIDALCDIATYAIDPTDYHSSETLNAINPGTIPALTRFLEKISLFRSKQ